MLERNSRESSIRKSLLRAFSRAFGGMSTFAILSVIALACALLIVRPALSQNASFSVESDRSSLAGSVNVPVNKSRVLRIATPFKELMVGNQEIADVLALSDRKHLRLF